MKIYVAGPFFNEKEAHELGYMISLIRSIFSENVETLSSETLKKYNQK